MRNSIIGCLIFALAAAGAAPRVDAGIFSEGVGGAMRGAVLGSLIGGREDAQAGAVIGGLVGAGRAAHRQRKQREQQALAERRRAEFLAQQQAERQRHVEQQQAAVATAQSTLLIETQKSLIRLGYDPGPIGTAGPKVSQAIMEYQRRMKLLETGEVSQVLLTHMLQNGG